MVYHQSIALNVTNSQYCTLSHCMHWLTQYGMWDFLRDTVGLIESDNFLTINFNLFICIWNKNFALLQINNYQFFNVLLSLQLKSQTPQTYRQFTPYLSICAPSDLTINKLAYTARLFHCQRPTLVVITKISLLVNLWSLVEGLVLSGCCTALYVTFSILHVSHAFQGSDKRTLFPFVGCSLGFRLKISGAIPASISLKVSSKDSYSAI